MYLVVEFQIHIPLYFLNLFVLSICVLLAFHWVFLVSLFWFFWGYFSLESTAGKLLLFCSGEAMFPFMWVSLCWCAFLCSDSHFLQFCVVTLVGKQFGSEVRCRTWVGSVFGVSASVIRYLWVFFFNAVSLSECIISLDYSNKWS